MVPRQHRTRGPTADAIAIAASTGVKAGRKARAGAKEPQDRDIIGRESHKRGMKPSANALKLLGRHGHAHVLRKRMYARVGPSGALHVNGAPEGGLKRLTELALDGPLARLLGVARELRSAIANSCDEGSSHVLPRQATALELRHRVSPNLIGARRMLGMESARRSTSCFHHQSYDTSKPSRLRQPLGTTTKKGGPKGTSSNVLV